MRFEKILSPLSSEESDILCVSVNHMLGILRSILIFPIFKSTFQQLDDLADRLSARVDLYYQELVFVAKEVITQSDSQGVVSRVQILFYFVLTCAQIRRRVFASVRQFSSKCYECWEVKISLKPALQF